MQKDKVKRMVEFAASKREELISAQRAAIEAEIEFLRKIGLFAAASFARIHYEAYRAGVDEAVLQEADVLVRLGKDLEGGDDGGNSNPS